MIGDIRARELEFAGAKVVITKFGSVYVYTEGDVHILGSKNVFREQEIGKHLKEVKDEVGR